MDVRFRRGWGWLLLATLTLSTLGDEISLITLMFRTAVDRTPFAVPLLLVAQLLPGLAAALADAAILAWMRGTPTLPPPSSARVFSASFSR